MANSTTNLDLISSSQASKEVTANALFDAESPASLYGRRASATANLTWGYYGGMLAIAGTPTAIANGTKTLTNGATNYVEADPTTGNVSVNTSNFTAANIPLYTVVTAGNLVTSYTDQRAFSFGRGVNGGNVTGMLTFTQVGTQEVISQDASIFREGQQSTMNSGTAYSTNGNLPIMKIWMHNTGINPSTGNFTAADATDYCTALIYSEDDKLKGFSSAAAVTAGNTPTLSNTWYLDNITGNQWINGTFTQGDATTVAGVTQVGVMFSSNSNSTSATEMILRRSYNGPHQASIFGLKSRGTPASPSVISSGDRIFSFAGFGFDGSNYVNAGSIILTSTGTISPGVVPGTLSFATANSSGVVTSALIIDSAQNTNVLVAQQLNSKLLFSATSPTISSGFGTSPSITPNGTLTFRLNVGTGGTASSGVIGLPTASTGWNVTCVVFNPTATNLLHTTSQTASTTSSATITNYLTSTGAATAWPASTVLIVTAIPY